MRDVDDSIDSYEFRSKHEIHTFDKPPDNSVSKDSEDDEESIAPSVIDLKINTKVLETNEKQQKPSGKNTGVPMQSSEYVLKPKKKKGGLEKALVSKEKNNSNKEQGF